MDGRLALLGQDSQKNRLERLQRDFASLKQFKESKKINDSTRFNDICLTVFCYENIFIYDYPKELMTTVDKLHHQADTVIGDLLDLFVIFNKDSMKQKLLLDIMYLLHKIIILYLERLPIDYGIYRNEKNNNKFKDLLTKANKKIEQYRLMDCTASIISDDDTVYTEDI